MKRRVVRNILWLLIGSLLWACPSTALKTQATGSETPSSPTPATITIQAPTVTPTPAPKPNPVAASMTDPTSVPTPTPEPVTEERIESGEFDSYFDDAVFIGDSLTEAFSNYVRNNRKTIPNFFGEARFMGAVAMSVKGACLDKNNLGISFTYRGKKVSISEGIKAMGAKKAFILLGLNDIASRRWEDVGQYFATLIDVLQEKCPETEIVIQGVFPVPDKFCRERGIQIGRWNSFNGEVLQRVCAEKGVELYEFSQLLMDENGYMEPAYASGAFHMSPEGNGVWLRAMRVYAAKKMCPGAEIAPELLLPPRQ